ncbi:hypothetical protein B7494_g4064 [Chlorociboria aeruginascens]|nr:hypothetical protein B7494_g4064 [Chlorociboria aeruginascens]
MASTNGVLTPPTHSDLTNPSITHSAKRKRDESMERHNLTNGINNDSKSLVLTEEHHGGSQIQVMDLIDILKRYVCWIHPPPKMTSVGLFTFESCTHSYSHDTSPSILTRPLPERALSAEHQAKRQKAEDIAEPSNIITRLVSNSYTTMDEVLEDIDAAVSDIVDRLHLPNNAIRPQNTSATLTQSTITTKLSAFKKMAHDLVQREKALKKETRSNSVMNTSSYMINGNLGANSLTQINSGEGEKKLVLTLYGNAPGPKQLFSSLQIPVAVNGESTNVFKHLEEAGLPNGITTTQIVPIQAAGIVENKRRVQTLGDLFPTPSNVLSMQPPKPSKIATTRSSTVGWYQPTVADGPSRSPIYSRQSITTGQWLDYSNASLSPSTKRKQRDRAMSLSGRVPLADVESGESETAKLDALFRGVYSSFAPTRDDSAAVAPQGMINRLWWQRNGEKSLDRLIENSQKLDDVLTNKVDMDDSAMLDAANEEDEFKEAVENWDEEAIDPSLVPLGAGFEKSAEEKDTVEVLQGISELLETLNSYQRIRHLSLNPSNRPAGLLSAPETTALGTPSKPSDSEFATYEILKSQLSLMIATLPPYAVAKLNSDQLAELRISTKIEVKMDDCKGIMEEDEAATRAKVAAMSATNSSNSRPAQPASLHRSSSSSLYGNQYAHSRPSSSQQYYGAQTPIRPPQPNGQRPPSTAPVPYQQRPTSSATFRPNPYPAVGYPHQASRPVQQYGTGTPQYPHNPGTPGYGRPSPNFQTVPQSAPQAHLATRYGNQGSYTPQSQNGVDYRYGNGNGVNVPRQNSPQKPLYSPQPTSAQAQPRFSTTTPTLPLNRQQTYLHQNPMMNGGSSQPHNQLGPTNYNTFMTTEQQSSMMERQRAQLAQQQGTQHQARNAAQAGAMGTPSKPQINGVPAGL